MRYGDFDAEAQSFIGHVGHVLRAQTKPMPSNDVLSDYAIEQMGRLNGGMMGRLSKGWHYLMSHR